MCPLNSRGYNVWFGREFSCDILVQRLKFADDIHYVALMVGFVASLLNDDDDPSSFQTILDDNDGFSLAECLENLNKCIFPVIGLCSRYQKIPRKCVCLFMSVVSGQGRATKASIGVLIPRSKPHFWFRRCVGRRWR